LTDEPQAYLHEPAKGPGETGIWRSVMTKPGGFVRRIHPDVSTLYENFQFVYSFFNSKGRKP
jgi:hypothetical protein